MHPQITMMDGWMISYFCPPHSSQCNTILESFFKICCSQTMKLPQAKLQPLVERLKVMSKRKKVCLRDLPSVIGTLNFACCVIAPGRTFLHRMIDLTVCVSLTPCTGSVLRVRRIRILRFGFFSCNLSFLPVDWTSSDVLHLASDGSGFAFGAVFANAWIQGQFPSTWQDVHISVKEILPIALAVRTSGAQLANRLILFSRTTQQWWTSSISGTPSIHPISSLSVIWSWHVCNIVSLYAPSIFLAN